MTAEPRPASESHATPSVWRLIRVPLIRGALGGAFWAVLLVPLFPLQGRPYSQLTVALPAVFLFTFLLLFPPGLVERWAEARGVSAWWAGGLTYVVELLCYPLALLQSVYAVTVWKTGSLRSALEVLPAKAEQLALHPDTALGVCMISAAFGVACWTRLRRHGWKRILGGGCGVLLLLLLGLVVVGTVCVVLFAETDEWGESVGTIAGGLVGTLCGGWSLLFLYWLADVVERRLGRPAAPSTLKETAAEQTGKGVWPAFVVLLGVGILTGVLAGGLQLYREARDAETLPALIQSLDSAQASDRIQAAKSLGALGSRAEPAVEALVKTLHDPDRAVRGSATSALASIGRPAVPMLIGALADEDWRVRANAAWSLRGIGEDAAAAAPALRAALEDEKLWVQVNAASALLAIDAMTYREQATPVLKRGLKADDQPVRSAAALALEKLEGE